MQASTNSNKSLGELFSDLSGDLSNLMRKEVQLAKTEMSENISRTVKNAILLVVAALFVVFALFALIVAAICGLSTVVAPWLAALIVAGALLVIAGALAMIGLNALKKASLAPKETVRTLQEDVQWAKQQI
ncbi:MAG TPA: phage holin family protein [Abditibacteriaceae bacterium]|jgi:uncharacterized membrane protein YqjE